MRKGNYDFKNTIPIGITLGIGLGAAITYVNE
jgi:hypothetical protein